jgi:predicted dehydrogenase
MVMKEVKVGIVGIGWWSDVLATALQKSPHLRLTACFSRDAEKTRGFAEKFGCEPVDSLNELVTGEKVEGVILTTPNSQHRAGVETAAAAGKHVFVEKPIANDLQDAYAIVAACRRAGVILSVGHSYRRHGGLRKLAEMIKRGELGRISLAQAIFSKDRGLRLKPGDWRSRGEEMPGGCLMQIGIHHIDNLIYLLGNVSEVSGMFAHLETAGAIADVAAILMRFANGAIGHVGVDYISADKFSLTVHGTDALATFDLTQGLTLFRRGQDAEERLAFVPIDYLRAELEEFALCIREHCQPEVDGLVAIQPLSVVLAAVESAAAGRTIALAPPEAALAREAR